jgi:hypothetical protein
MSRMTRCKAKLERTKGSAYKLGFRVMVKKWLFRFYCKYGTAASSWLRDEFCQNRPPSRPRRCGSLPPGLHRDSRRMATEVRGAPSCTGQREMTSACIHEVNVEGSVPWKSPSTNGRNGMRPAAESPSTNGRNGMGPAVESPSTNGRNGMGPAAELPSTNGRNGMRPTAESPSTNGRNGMMLADTVDK